MCIERKQLTMPLRDLLRAATLCALGCSSLLSDAQTDTAASERTGIYEEVFVTGGAGEIATLSGSATLVDEEAIANFVTTDINALLSRVPGVYVRQEDGFGLRPNINLRGTSSDRSTKITIMEDGILIGPAPYSAPAAYYVPNVTRMQALEVFKGPASIRHGPHTVGGAINFVTRKLPADSAGELEAAAGTDGFQRYRGFYGKNTQNFGFWLDALRYGSDGFKELDGGGDTGFVRNDINAKFLWRIDRAKVYQELELKLGYAEEDADETYLGLTDEDLAQNPNRRYVASQLDRFESEHRQAHLIHSADFNAFKVTTRAYYHEFERAWNKVDGIIDGEAMGGGLEPRTDIYDVLANPGFFASQLALLRGERNSDVLSAERIDITNNDRAFDAYGVKTGLSWQNTLGRWTHDWDVGLRFHHDRVERDHSPRGYLMQDRRLVFDGDESRPKKALNEGESDAWAAYASDQISVEKWRFDLGVRFEAIDSKFSERAPGRERGQSDSQSVVIPGAGVFYEVSERFGVLAGVNKGFSSKAASARIDTDPEESINYEAGVRYRTQTASMEVIGFFSDVDSLLGRCRASEVCAGEEFNSGAAEVYGVEVTADYQWQLESGLRVPIFLVYTYSQSEFTESFISDFNQWGEVDAGDEFPYLPEHQGRAEIALQSDSWSAGLALKYIGKMRETAGAGDYVEGDFTAALTTLDLALSYSPHEALTLKLIGENITDAQEIVSRRPFGARPNQPTTLKAGVEYRF